jgi:hypothetical protein
MHLLQSSSSHALTPEQQQPYTFTPEQQQQQLWVGTVYREDVSERVCANISFYKTKNYYEPACFEK